jgi:ZIP family zinc transporter
MAVQAGLWGLLAGSALVLGALAGYFLRIPQRVTAAIMAFGAGVLISAVCFDLMDEAFARGGLGPSALGLLAGAGAYTLANVALARAGARDRKRSGDQQPTDSSSGTALAVGALLDGVPESIVIGVSLLAGEGVSAVAVASVFLSNVPEGLSSSAGMRRAGRPAHFVLILWSAIALASGAAALLGYVAFDAASPAAVAAVQALAAGAILAMLADTMIPEAYEEAHDFAGLITVAGFFTAFALTKSVG